MFISVLPRNIKLGGNTAGKNQLHYQLHYPSECIVCEISYDHKKIFTVTLY